MNRLLLFVFVLVNTQAIAQREKNHNTVYFFNTNVQVTRCNATGTVLTPALLPGGAPVPAVAAAPGIKALAAIPGTNPQLVEVAFRKFEFKVDGEVGDNVIIHFVKWTNAEDNNGLFYGVSTAARSNIRPDYYFLLSKSVLNSDVSVGEITPRLTFMIGTITMPVKIRFGSKRSDEVTGKPKERYFDFQGSLNIGLNVGLSVNLNKRKSTKKDFLNLLGGISLSSVPVDSATTKGFLKEHTNSSCLTWNSTLLYQRDNFQIGVFVGQDLLAGELGRQWIYRDKLWLGVGIGFSILRTKKSTDTQD